MLATFKKKPFNISFIIPVLNEEETIGDTIKFIQENVPAEIVYEIIVVDNGSVDATCEIVRTFAVVLLKNVTGTIAFIRNYGVSHSSGEVLLFIDADVLLTKRWGEFINPVLESLSSKPLQVTGSRCGVNEDKTWLNKYWFGPMAKIKNTNYINSGHLITSRELFHKLNGFDTSLFTAEDYDFCQRALSCGAKIIENPNLKVVHVGYPSQINSFVTRERWHGREDFLSIEKIFRSKIAILVLVNCFITFFSIVFFIRTSSIAWITGYAFYMIFGCICFYLYKFGKCSPRYCLFGSVISFFYLLGRTLALVDAVLRKKC